MMGSWPPRALPRTNRRLPPVRRGESGNRNSAVTRRRGALGYTSRSAKCGRSSSMETESATRSYTGNYRSSCTAPTPALVLLLHQPPLHEHESAPRQAGTRQKESCSRKWRTALIVEGRRSQSRPGTGTASWKYQVSTGATWKPRSGRQPSDRTCVRICEADMRSGHARSGHVKSRYPHDTLAPVPTRHSAAGLSLDPPIDLGR